MDGKIQQIQVKGAIEGGGLVGQLWLCDYMIELMFILRLLETENKLAGFGRLA